MWEATALVLSYGGYVIVCAKYGFLVKLICPMKASDTSESGGLEGPLLAEDEVTSVNASKNQVIRHIGAQGLDRRGPAGSCRLFLGPGFRLAARWNRLVETVKTRKKREKTGKKWARYGLKRVKESGSPGRR